LRHSSSLRFVAVLAVVATGAVLFASAVVAKSSAPSRIYACVSNRTGIPRLVSASKRCRRGEHKISWVASSARGAVGIPGARGPTGPGGTAGAPGVAGAAGTPGPTGPAGIPGTAAARGATGPPGAVGPTGARGPTGPQGPSGSRGTTGATGPPGSRGPTGARGPTGPGSLTGLLTVTSSAVSGTSATQACPAANPNVVGGGYNGIGGSSTTQYASASYPSSASAWSVTLNVTDSSWTIYAICSK